MKSRNNLRLMTMILTMSVLSIFIFPLASAIPDGWADNVVISEIYHSSLARNAQFIELYNPTNQDINISGWAIETELNDRTILFPNTQIIDVDVFLPVGEIIPAYGYYLIAGHEWETKRDVETWPEADFIDRFYMGMTSQFFMDSGIILRNNNGDVVDKIGWGNIGEIPPGMVEGTPIENIVNVGTFTYERKPATDGDGEQGNGIDTDNNAADFEIVTPNPQNSLSSPEIPDGAQICNTAADTDCNNIISNIELAIYANLWYTNQGVSNIQLALAAQAWYQG